MSGAAKVLSAYRSPSIKASLGVLAKRDDRCNQKWIQKHHYKLLVQAAYKHQTSEQVERPWKDTLVVNISKSL